MNKWQDIDINDSSLKTEFINKFFNTDFISAFSIIANNPQLNSKAFLASVMNDIANILSLLQDDFQNEIIDYLASQIENFQIIIDNYALKENWDSQTIYTIYNFVIYNDKIYMYINPSASSGNLPTNTNYWLDLNLKGENGGGGINVVMKYDWDSSIHYNALDVVYYNDVLWVAKIDNDNVIPSNGATWEVFLPFNLIKIYSDTSEPNNLYEGLIWFEMLNS